MLALVISGALMSTAAGLYIAVYLLSDIFERAQLTRLDWRIIHTIIPGMWATACVLVILAIVTLTLN